MTRIRPALVLAAVLALVAGASVYDRDRRADLEPPLEEACAPLPDDDAAPRTRCAEALFVRMLRGERGDGLGPMWRALGFVVRPDGVGDAVTVRDAEGGHRGRYALRDGWVWPLALQAPHRLSDRHTGRIARRLFAEGPFAAAAWNTAPRRSRGPDGEEVDRDLAHLRDTHFNAFTRAFGRVYPDGLVVQLHGFARGKRATRAGRTADVILSDTTEAPGPAALAAAECLKRDVPGVVRLYPTEVGELGGTTNANAAALREMGLEGRFLHVEMSPELRLRLRDDAALRRRFTGCLVEAAKATRPPAA